MVALAWPLRSGGMRWPTLVYIVTVDLMLAVLILDETQRMNLGPSVIHGVDAANYWSAWQGGLYHGTRLVYGDGVYLYSPAFAEVLAPLTRLVWPIFRLAWSTATLVTFAWMLKPAPTIDRLLLAPIAFLAAAAGGVEWIYCIVLVFGLRYPALWALPVLTKVTSGVGLVWFVARHEWRNLAIALGATVSIVLVSFAFAPDLWSNWIDVLYRNATITHYGGVIGLLPLRVGLAAVIAWVGARRGQPASLVAAMVLAAPDINWTAAGLVLALPRLVSGGATAIPLLGRPSANSKPA